MPLRISLDDTSTAATEKMIEKIRESFPECSISPSDLSSWIVLEFSKTNFEKSKSRIASHYFNPKAFLRSRIKEIDSAEKLEQILNEVRTKLKPKGVNARKPNGEEGATSPEELLGSE